MTRAEKTSCRSRCIPRVENKPVATAIHLARLIQEGWIKRLYLDKASRYKVIGNARL